MRARHRIVTAATPFVMLLMNKTNVLFRDCGMSGVCHRREISQLKWSTAVALFFLDLDLDGAGCVESYRQGARRNLRTVLSSSDFPSNTQSYLRLVIRKRVYYSISGKCLVLHRAAYFID